ncbi:DUF7507 domain-containing protein [Nitriliruptor alkaliphilus]|uniref:DUF7507 domain-containing protein n=1 Tax=Nitriliruptor alkaliphilus TaxID=427918 RepID=UPI0006973EF4|nr:DUF11 domain-containing protein [Nitriliruptor alkaliphilus]
MAFKCLLVTVVLGLLHGLVGLGALASHAQANPVYEITARWADGELTQARSGESVVSEWRISVNDDAAAPSNDPVDDVTFTVTATNGVFTSIPGPCLTEEVTTPSSISADGTALTCNLGTLNMGTAVVAQIPVVVDGAVGDELGLSGDIGELTASPDTTIQITGDFGMDITWQNPTSWARWLNNDTTIRVDYQWTLNLLNGSEAGPNSVSYTLDLDPSTGGTITALACVPFQFDMASGHPWSAGDFPPEQTAPYVDTCTLTSTGVANQFTMTLTGIDYSLTQVPTMDSGGNLLPTDRSAIASGRIVFDMPATTAGSISLTSSTPTYTSVSGATYTDDGGNNTVSKTFALPGGWASAYMRVHTGQGGTNWDYTYWAAPGTTLSVNNHSRLHTNSNNLGLQMQQCTVLDTNYVTYSDTNPHVPGTSNEDGTGRHLGDGTGRWIDGEFEYTRWYYVGNHGSVTPGSATYDPETFAANCELDPGGWTTTLPADLSTVKAVRLSYQITGDLYEFHSIVMRTYPTIKADAPVGQDIWQFSSYRLGTNAWNYNTTQVITPTPGARYPHTNAWRDVVRVAGVEPYLEKSVDRAVVQVGEPFVYTIGYAANGDAAAPETVDGFTIVDMLPLGVEYVPGSSSIGEPTITVHDSGRQVLTWTLDGVPTNQLHAFTFQAVATEDAPTGVILRNRVDASLDGLNAIPKVADVTLSESGSTTIGKTADQAYIPNLDGDGVGTGSWTVTLRSYDTETQDFTDTIDILPYNGDERGTDFTGTYTLTGVTALPGATVYYTTADPATLSDDPADPSNGSPGDVTGNTVGWTTVFTPDATAVRVIGPELAPGETQSFTITIATSGATGGDVLVNRAHGRTEHTELSMLTSSLTSVANYYSASLKKYVQDADGVWRDAEVVEDYPSFIVGDEVTYLITVENTGEGTLTGIVVDDDRYPEEGGFTIDTLAPGETASHEFTVVATEEMQELSPWVNVASASADIPEDSEVAPTINVDQAGIEIEAQAPELTLVKSAEVVDVNGNALTDAGDEIWYSFTVTNDGNVTLTDVSVDDPLLADAGITITCDPTTLLPGDSVVCTADAAYVITQADVDAGAVENVAIGMRPRRMGVRSSPTRAARWCPPIRWRRSIWSRPRMRPSWWRVRRSPTPSRRPTSATSR